MRNGIGEEDNNNTHIRRGSEGSENSEGWMEVASQDSEPTITSFTHSYRYVQFHNTHIRRGSEGSENSEGWMEVASQDSEPTITSFTHSYRFVQFHNTHIR